MGPDPHASVPGEPSVVVRSPNWLGDAVMALPAIRDVRRHFAASRVAVAAPAGLSPLYKLVEGVDEVVALNGRVRWGGWQRDPRDLAALGGGRFEIGILLPNSFGSAWLMYKAGIPQRWGYRGDFRGPLLTRAIRPPRARQRRARHHGLYYQDLLSALGVEPGPLESRLLVAEATAARGRAALDREGCDPEATPIVGFAPGAAYGHAKRWPPGRVAEVIHRLTREVGVTCIIVGSAADRETARAVESSLAGPGGLIAASVGRVLDFTGRTDLDLLVGLMRWCRAFVSNDSGAMHLAAAVGVPVTAIFGPTNERATAPLGPHEILSAPVWCRPCMLRECPIDHRCMKRITPAMVFDSIVRQIDRDTRRPS